MQGAKGNGRVEVCPLLRKPPPTPPEGGGYVVENLGFVLFS